MSDGNSSAKPKNGRVALLLIEIALAICCVGGYFSVNSPLVGTQALLANTGIMILAIALIIVYVILFFTRALHDRSRLVYNIASIVFWTLCCCVYIMNGIPYAADLFTGATEKAVTSEYLVHNDDKPYVRYVDGEYIVTAFISQDVAEMLNDNKLASEEMTENDLYYYENEVEIICYSNTRVMVSVEVDD